MDRFQNQDQSILEEGNHKATAILNDSAVAPLLMAQAAKASPDVNKKPKTITRAKVVTIIVESNGLTTRGVQAKLESFGQKMSYGRVWEILRSLRDDGSIEARKERDVFTWKTKGSDL